MKRKKLLIFCWLFVITTFSLSYISNNDSLETSSSGNEYLNADIQLLARCVMSEAHGEPYNGQVAVAAVILNRVNHSAFPNTLSGVIFQPGAFTSRNNVSVDENSTVYRACRDAINGADPTGGAIYYGNPQRLSNTWIMNRQAVTSIGNYIFFL